MSGSALRLLFRCTKTPPMAILLAAAQQCAADGGSLDNALRNTLACDWLMAEALRAGSSLDDIIAAVRGGYG